LTATAVREPWAALAKRSFRDGRIRTLAFAYLFAAYAYIQPVGYRHAYPTSVSRLAFAQSLGRNVGLRLLYGDPHRVETVDGYTAWRVGGILAVAAAGFGLFAAVRAFRAEEDAGRTEVVLAGIVSRRALNLSALVAIAASAAVLWLAEFLGFVLAHLPATGSAYLALASASVIPVCVGVGAVASQLAPTRRVALELGGAIVGLLFLLRAVADTSSGLGRLRWTTPLGWAEEMRPLTGAQPLVLLLPATTTLLLLAAAVRIAARRDIGTGVLPARDTADARLWLLGSPAAQALRESLGALIAWAGSFAVFGFILGTISKSISSADVSTNVQRQIAKLGTGSIVTPTGYLAFVFIFVILAVSVFMCTQVGAARQEEAEQQLETLLALPVSRRGWLAGRLALAVLGGAALCLVAGFFTWAGASSGGAHVSLPRILEAGVNAMPVAILFLGLAAVAYAVVPRAATAVGYGLVTISFVWQLVGSLLAAPSWLVDLTPFAHAALVPAEPFRTGAALVMVAIGLVASAAAIGAFERRDLISA
jgi:ABC-2 type transport system permease protein